MITGETSGGTSSECRIVILQNQGQCSNQERNAVQILSRVMVLIREASALTRFVISQGAEYARCILHTSLNIKSIWGIFAAVSLHAS
jgi:hypothetical protein